MGDQGKRVGPWTIIEEIGEGGNGVVWLASDPDGQRCALKLLKARRAQAESYKRFVREITFLLEHRDLPGILPLVDAHLPDEPTRADQPWSAMPVATPIAKALAEGTLEDVVRAMRTIAETLARLESDHGVGHRDIKPGNLYELDGQWLIGDFGLIAVPDAETLTGDGRPVGPAHFTAYEMVSSPSTADPHPADVFSLGKTLWVLATAQNWPPLGHQPAGPNGFSIGDFRPHRNAGRLDELVDRMTRARPTERPTKTEVASELATWLDLAKEPASFDLSDRRAAVRAKLGAAFAEKDAAERLREAEQRAIRRLTEMTKPLNNGLKDLFPEVEVDLSTDEATRNIVKSNLDYEAVLLHRWHRCTRVVVGTRPASPGLSMSRSIEVFRDGRLAFTWMIDASPQGVMGGRFYTQGPVRDVAQAESIEVDAMLERQVSAMSEALTKAVDALMEALPES